MKNYIIIAVIVFLGIGGYFVYQMSQISEISPKQKVKLNTSNKTYSLEILMESVKYGQSEYSHRVDSTIEFEDFADKTFQKRILSEIQPFIYAINDLKYDLIVGSIQGTKDNIDVNIRGYLEPKKELKYDDYSFLFSYDQQSDKLTLEHKSFTGYAIPDNIINLSIEIAKRDRKVKSFLEKYNTSFGESIYDPPLRIPTWIKNDKTETEVIQLSAREIVSGTGSFEVLNILIDPWKEKIIDITIRKSGQIID